jgi:hypothetical protein
MNGEYTQIICTNMLATKTAFGVRTADGSQVFIPASISAAIDLRVSDMVMASHHRSSSSRRPVRRRRRALGEYGAG